MIATKDQDKESKRIDLMTKIRAVGIILEELKLEQDQLRIELNNLDRKDYITSLNN